MPNRFDFAALNVAAELDRTADTDFGIGLAYDLGGGASNAANGDVFELTEFSLKAENATNLGGDSQEDAWTFAIFDLF